MRRLSYGGRRLSRGWSAAQLFRREAGSKLRSITPQPLRRERLPGAAKELRERRRLELDSLLEEPVEEQATVVGAAAVEAEGELVEVVVELLRPHRALMGAEQPALQERGDAVDTRHRHVRGIAGRVEAVPFVRVAGLGDAVVAGVAVAADDAAGLDQIFDRGEEAVGARVGNRSEAHTTHAAPALLHGDQDRRLLLRATAMLAGRDATEVALVHLDLAGGVVLEAGSAVLVARAGGHVARP